MALPDNEWLPRARSLAVGMTMRVQHRSERRHNLTIGNERDRWWAYCQACKDGGKVIKEHVLLATHYHAVEHKLELPTDIVPLRGTDYEVPAHRFLASKGMAQPYLPDLYVSPTHRRLMLMDVNGMWHGRDLTERSNQKWLHYGCQFSGNPGPLTICTEDLFSMFKVAYALKHRPDIAVCSTLGANAGPATVLALKECQHLVWFYDGDKAGDFGYLQASKRMRPFVPKHTRIRPPEGCDPKDCTINDIVQLVQEKLPWT